MPTEHVTIEHSECHEPRHISISGSSDAGKVITSSSTTAGTSVYRFLEASELASTGIPAGASITANGDGTMGWVVGGSVYAYSHSVTSATGPVETTDMVPVSIAHQISSNSAGNSWDNGSDYLTIPEDGVYKVHFTVCLLSGTDTLLYALPATTVPLSSDAFVTSYFYSGVGGAPLTTMSGTVVDTFSQGQQVRLYIGNSVASYPISEGDVPNITSATARSMYIEKVG